MKTRLSWIGGVLLGSATLANAQSDAATELRKELDAIRGDYEKRINQLEARIQELETKPKAESKQAPKSNADDTPKPRKKTPKMEEPGPVHQKNSEREIGDTDPEPDARNAEMEAKALERAQRKAADEKFKGNTEIRDLARDLNDENLVADRIEEVLEGYLDISGYFRAGYGRSNEGGPQQAFGIPDLAKYRLGNEAENYGELAFAKTFFPLGMFGGEKGELDGPIARMTYRMSFYNPYDNYGSAQDTQFASPEVWADRKSVV